MPLINMTDLLGCLEVEQTGPDSWSARNIELPDAYRDVSDIALAGVAGALFTRNNQTRRLDQTWRASVETRRA